MIEPIYFSFLAGVNDTGKRVDAFLVERQTEASRSQLKHLVHRITINKKPITKLGTTVDDGDFVEFSIPPRVGFSTEADASVPFHILFEDDELLVIEKPAGVVVHPGAGNENGTLLNGIIAHLSQKSELPDRAGIVHRLDRDTSGLLMVAKTRKMHAWLSEAIKNHLVEKKYLALVSGNFPTDDGSIDAPIARSVADRKKMAVSARGTARDALTHFCVIERFNKPQTTLVEVRLITGRTHQIRVHFSAIGNPVVGDPTYGSAAVNREFVKRFGLSRQFLHATFLRVPMPDGSFCEFKSVLPSDVELVVTGLRGDGGRICY